MTEAILKLKQEIFVNRKKLIILGLIAGFFVVLPLILFSVSQYMDRIWGFYEVLPIPLNVLGSMVFVILGFLVLESVLVTLYNFFNHHSVSDLLIMSPREGLYNHSRHPLFLAFILWLLGFAILLNSFSLIILSALIVAGFIKGFRWVEQQTSPHHKQSQIPFLMPPTKELLSFLVR